MRAGEKGQERILEKGESVNKEALKSLNSQEVNSLVSSARLASGTRLPKNIQDFESMSETLRLTRVCEDAIFVLRVSAGMSYKTKPDEDDGFRTNHPIMQRIHTFESKPTIQSICGNSWRNNCWTSH